MIKNYSKNGWEDVMKAIVGMIGLLALLAPAWGQPRFQVTDITGRLGLQAPERLPLSGRFLLTEQFKARPLPLDFDADGDLDLLFCYGPLAAETVIDAGNRLYRNDDTAWVDVTEQTGLSRLPPASRAAAGDVDGDGYPDLYLCTFGHDWLLRNDGGLWWEDITGMAGISNPSWATDAQFLDANGDGLLDIYVSNYIEYSGHDTLACYDPETRERIYCDPDLYDPAPNRLFVADSSGQYYDRTAELGMADTTSRSLQVLTLDANGDDQLDLLVLSYRSANLLYLHRPGEGYVEAGLRAGVAYAPDGSAPLWNQVVSLDANSDGSADLLFTRRDGGLQLLLNDGAGHFTEGHYQTGLFQPRTPHRATSVAVLDLDFNGSADLLLADPSRDLRRDSLLVTIPRDSLTAPPPNDSLFTPTRFDSVTWEIIYKGFRRALIRDSDGQFQLAAEPVAMVLDTVLLIHREPEEPQGIMALDDLEDDAATSFMPPIRFGENPLARFSSRPASGLIGEDTAATTMAPEKVDRLRITEEADGYIAADLDRDGVAELLTTYPSGLVRIWRQEHGRPRQFIGLQLRAPGRGATVMGAVIRVTADGESWRRLVKGPTPQVVYFPQRVGAVDVEVTWPDGVINTYRTSQLNRYYTLTKRAAGS